MAATRPPPPPSESLATYVFPSARLQCRLSDPTKTPLVLVACGSFSPITHMHLRMFEMAVDHVKQNMAATYEVVGGYLSPVSDSYNKAGLASALHRVRMCELACNEASTWLMVDPWEALQPTYQPTAVVLDHISTCINTHLGGISGVPAKIMLLGGSDLLQTMSQPGVWSAADLEHILGGYGVFVIERNGADVSEALAPLQRWEDNIIIVRQLIANDISSTRIRQFIRQGMSVRYLLPAVVVDYIGEHRLYGEHEEFRETRSSSMPPFCMAKAAEEGGQAGQGSGLEVPRPACPARCMSAQGGRGPSRLREESVEDDGEVADEEARTTEEEYTRGRRPSS